MNRKKAGKAHVDCIGPNNIKRVDVREEIPDEGTEKEKIIYVYLYDNLDFKDTGITLDYVKEEEQDANVAAGFKGCSIIPLFKLENGATPIQPHLNELQDNYIDMLSAGQLSETNPENDNNDHIYKCVIVSNTRTITKKQMTDNNRIEVTLDIVSEEVANTEGDDIAWIGVYKKDDVPAFLKVKIIRYEIENLYVNFGELAYPNENEPNTGVEYRPYHNGDDNDVNVDLLNRGGIKIDHCLITNASRDLAGFLYEKNRFEDDVDDPTCNYYLTPGYRVALEPIMVDGNEIGTAILSYPLLAQRPQEVYVPKEIECRVAAESVICELGNDEYNTEDFAVQKDGIYSSQKPVLSFAIKNVESYATESKIITKANSRLLLEAVNKIKGFKLEGPIKVYNLKEDGTLEKEKVCTLQYIESVAFTNCEFHDKPNETTGGIEYMWFYNCTFEDCDIQMKYYRSIKYEEQLIGSEQEKPSYTICVSRPVARRGNRKAIAPFTSVDMLYNFLMETRTYGTTDDCDIKVETQDGLLPDTLDGKTIDVTEKVGYFKYTKNEDVVPTLESCAQEEANVFILGVLGEVRLGTSYTTIKLGAYIEDSKGETNMEVDGVTKQFTNIHYGLVGSLLNEKIDKFFDQVNAVTISATGKEITPQKEGTFTINFYENGEKKEEQVRKLTRAAMLDYIGTIEKMIQIMPLNRRYINELLGYVAKIVGFEALRLPCVIQTGDDKGKGLESADSGVVEPFTESFTQDGVTYNPSTESEVVSYKFAEGANRHAEMVAKIENLFRAMTTLSNELDTITGSTVTVSSEQLLYDNLVELLSAWEEYYKGRVVADASQLTAENTQLEMYEEENVYKIFISVMQQDGTEDTTVVKSLVSTDGADADVDSSALEQFITGVLDWLKPEIKEIFNVKEDIKNMSITDFVSYNDPIKQKAYSYQMANPESNADQKNKNDLIEYSQMLSLIQEERNKIQRKGLKDKLIVKFVQTEKGTYFELLGTEMIDSDSTSKVFGYFLSENSEGNTSGEGMEPDHHVPTKPKGTKRKSRKEARTLEKEQEPSFEKIPEKRDEQYHLRLTKVPVFYAGEPLDWRNDNYYSNKVYLHNLDNLYVGIDPEYAARVNTVQTVKEETLEDNSKKTTILEKDMIGYYLVNIEYEQQ